LLLVDAMKEERSVLRAYLHTSYIVKSKLQKVIVLGVDNSIIE
jgi:hypothetical protein